MSSWLEKDTFSVQMSEEAVGKAEAAPCPSDFPLGHSYWIEEFPIDFEDECRVTPLPDEVDVVVIGTGITAAACLYNLASKSRNLKVAVIEARGICTGATGRNGGHICRSEGTEFRGLVEKVGLEEALRLSHLGTCNRDLMLAAIYDLDIAEEVDLQLTGTRVVFASQDERDSFQAELDYAQEMGVSFEGYVADVNELCKSCIISPEKAKYGAACIDKSGTIYPRKFVSTLLRDASKRMPHLTIHAYNPVRAVTKLQDTTAPRPAYDVKTDKGSVCCKAVVHATNAYASYLIPSLRGLNGVLGCKAECIAIAPNVPCSDTASTPSGLRGGLGFDEFWHWLIQRPRNGPFIYGWSGVELVGNYDDSETLPKAADGKNAGEDEMARFLEEAFPQSFKDIDWKRDVQYRWTGIQGFTKTGASLVGRYSEESPGEFISVGHNGEGMGRCFASATVLIDRLMHYLDGKNEDAWTAPDWFPRSFLQNI